MKYYQEKIEEIFSTLNTDIEGLSNKEAEKRLTKYGENKLSVKKERSKLLLFFSQFKDILTIMLLVASTLSLFIGSYRDAGIMLAIVIINVIVGFAQENKAEAIMSSLKKLVQSPAKVYRDKKIQKLKQEKIVPGDIVVLEEGDKTPADLRIIEAFNLRINEVSLTGESLPQEKHSNCLKEESSLGDQANMAFLGTNVASGSAKGVVVRTGMETEMGKIASLTQEENKSQTPLQKELGVVASRLAIFAIIIGFILFGISLYRGLGLYFALLYGLGITVAIVPQALPMQITVALSQGVDRLAQKNAVVKKLSSAETLGSTNVIATDKTGTLTKNEMTVKTVWFDGKEYEITGLGYQPEGDILDQNGKALDKKEIEKLSCLFEAATMASNAEIHPPDENHANWYPIGDPTEAALITLSTKLGVRSPNEDKENPEIHEFSFDSKRKRMSSIREIEDKNILTMKGAINSILTITRHIYCDGKKVTITEKDKKELNKLNEKYSKNAMRVLAVAYRRLEQSEKDYVIEEIERDVVFLGLVAMIDPPKEGVKEAIADAHTAQIDTFIMTGDHAITAKAIGEEINLGAGKDIPVFTSKELNDISDNKLKKIMQQHKSLIFSRVSPEDKLRIVKNLKEQNKIVAVTGDGVNDAPALKSAHIGVAMGQMGTDVSKEAAELVLLDDSYPTLVQAIKEGRTIYNNLKKTVLASLTTNGAELAIVLFGLIASTLLDWPIPILAIQILSIDLLAEILPLTALTFDPASRDLMIRAPRDKDEHMLNTSTVLEVGFLGLLMGLLAFINYYIFASGRVNFTAEHPLYPRATTITYLTIVICQFINIMSRRYKFSSIFSSNFFSNRKMIYSLIISIALVLLVIYTPINSYLEFTPPLTTDWLLIFTAGAIYLLSFEVIKWFKRKNKL
ncbi:HAD-IC family P-type ATPase [Iocasia frigidifontis]|uniref:HAD-IC family P-type ATPase n=1 Tax=Iocasia fonsfrigidae TaxID=2682810 RepID=A0A8A7KA59_9FIRM|nr:cation-translocating P-type ATPase [Iocasia fonsfrigidae]QTL98683.1 HAD-IC family P-type ATPase [Iocasia fonsfrigidae]